MLIPLGLRDNTSNTAYPSATRTPPSPQRFYNTKYPTSPLYNTAYHITAQTPRLTNSATQTPPAYHSAFQLLPTTAPLTTYNSATRTPRTSTRAPLGQDNAYPTAIINHRLIPQDYSNTAYTTVKLEHHLPNMQLHSNTVYIRNLQFPV